MEAVFVSSNEVPLGASPSNASLNNPHVSRKSSVLLDANFLKDRPIVGPSRADSRITINVCGRRFELPVSLLSKHSGTLLGDPAKRGPFYDGTRDEYFFSRNQSAFKAIMNYYQSGVLRRPANCPLDAFLAEARFFQLEREALVEFCSNEGFPPRVPEPLPSNRLRRKIWKIIAIPESSSAAKAFAIFSIFMILLSLIVYCIETLPQFRQSTPVSDDQLLFFHQPFFSIETACFGWFTAEFVLRFLTCPSKARFMKSPLSVIDLIAIVPYYIDLAVTVSSNSSLAGSQDPRPIHSNWLVVLRIVRIVRVFRILRFSRYSKGLQILGQTALLSWRELCLLLLFLGMGVVMFSSAAYYAELGTEETHFNSIPDGFWWAIVTMTTVGYGDMSPKGVFGKMIGAVCAVSGLLAVALPVPVIVANFNTIYRREKERPYVEAILHETMLDSLITLKPADFAKTNLTDDTEAAKANGHAGLKRQTRKVGVHQNVGRLPEQRQRLLTLNGNTNLASTPAGIQATPACASFQKFIVP